LRYEGGNDITLNRQHRIIIITTTTNTNLTQSASMAPVFVDLSAPNGHKWTQPVGLFINNEFVGSKDAKTLAVVNPA
jgi:hypothetical protein